MTVNIDNELETDFDFLDEDTYTFIANTVISDALSEENCPYEIEVDLLLTDDTGIHELNNEFRNIDKSTDVLSFPLCEYEKAGDFSLLKDDPNSFNPDTGELLLGDIVISVPTCIRQADEYGHSIEREFAFLIAHSMLHLMGYDHMIKDEEEIMNLKAENILAIHGFKR